MKARGWDDVDVVFVTGDAYVDHPASRWASWAGCWRPTAFGSRSEPARLAERADRGGSSAGRGCSSPSAPATWTR